LAVVAIAAVVVIVLSSGGGSAPPVQSASSTGATPRHATTTHAAATAPAPGRITVAVLNGTATPGLANTVATTLTNAGFVKGPVGNASNQQRSVTVVSYFGGHEQDALEVARTLRVPSDAVQPIDADTEAACGGGAGACAASVVVTVGADRG
ncbi:MAG TPA: LytR C-terminal domain-containing protein, partial [Conexibacter sp.]|nr:LytR C-terminal domain-containing protein [Conexibacter sp.]